MGYEWNGVLVSYLVDVKVFPMSYGPFPISVGPCSKLSGTRAVH